MNESAFWHAATGHHLIVCDGGPGCQRCVAQFLSRRIDDGAAIVCQSPATEVQEIVSLMDGPPPGDALALLPTDASPDELLVLARTACRQHGQAAVYRHAGSHAPGYLLHLERQLGLLCRDSTVSVLCHEERLEALDGAELAAVHGGNVSDGRLLQIISRDGGLRLCGEIDASNEELLRWLLAAATRTGDGSLHLDLAELRFVSSAAAGVLVADTAAFRGAGGRVVLHEPGALVGTVLQAMGLDKVSNMRVCHSPPVGAGPG